MPLIRRILFKCLTFVALLFVLCVFDRNVSSFFSQSNLFFEFQGWENGSVKTYFDLGSGYSEKDATLLDVRDYDSQRQKVPLPNGWTKIRVDFEGNPRVIHIHAMSIGPFFKVSSFSLDDRLFRSNHELIKRSGFPDLQYQLTPDAVDPFFEFQKPDGWDDQVFQASRDGLLLLRGLEAVAFIVSTILVFFPYAKK